MRGRKLQIVVARRHYRCRLCRCIIHPITLRQLRLGASGGEHYITTVKGVACRFHLNHSHDEIELCLESIEKKQHSLTRRSYKKVVARLIAGERDPKIIAHDLHLAIHDILAVMLQWKVEPAPPKYLRGQLVSEHLEKLFATNVRVINPITIAAQFHLRPSTVIYRLRAINAQHANRRLKINYGGK